VARERRAFVCFVPLTACQAVGEGWEAVGEGCQAVGEGWEAVVRGEAVGEVGRPWVRVGRPSTCEDVIIEREADH
jgi:hypothetical protein